MKKFTLMALALTAWGCTDTGYASISALGEPANIVCYSGGKENYRGRSTGVLHSESGSDGWAFQEVGTGHLVRVSGSCVIRQKTGSSVTLPPWTATDAGSE